MHFIRGSLKVPRGATLVLVAVILVPLLAVLGLAVDLGSAYRQKRIAQIAADAGAIAGALEIYRGRTDSLLPSARSESSRNGFTDGVGGIAVNASNPPATGSYTASSRFVEVSITDTVQTLFARVLGFNVLAVKARAVAGLQAPSSTCMFVMSETESPALQISNGASVDASGCGITVNSNGQKAIEVKGGASSLTAASISVRGGVSTSANGTISPAASTGSPLVPNPLGYLEMPAVPVGCTCTNKEVSSNDTLNPGTYCGGLKIKGGSTKVTLNAGSYFIVGGGVILESNAKITGTGVTIINTFNSSYAFKPLDFRSGVDVTLSAPTTGSLAGILFFEDPSAPSGNDNNIGSGSDSNFTGTFYFPVNPVTFATGSGTTITGAVVAKRLTFSTSGSLRITGATSGAPYPLKRVSLVE